MPAGQMPLRPADDAEASQRIAAYAAAARATALQTEPADRRRAERAIRNLYSQRGKSEPHILWVPSPVGGALTYAVASGDRTEIRNEAAKGDVGSGANAYWYGLADPFPLPHGTAARVRDRIHNRIPSGTPRDLNLGLRTWESVPDAIRAGLPELCARVATRPLSPLRRDDEAAWTLGRKLLGSDAERLAGMFGAEPFALVLQSVVRRAFTEATTDPGRVRKAVQAMQPGQFDRDTPFLAAIERVFGAPIWRTEPRRVELLNLIRWRLDIAASAGPWWALDGLAIVSERPLRVAVDDRDRLHSETGPALAYGDGIAIHAWHGVRVDSWIINQPERITVGGIDEMENAEVRRVMVERFGAERLVREGSAVLVHEDETGRLWRRQLPTNWLSREEPVVMVEVVNSTPEPDGTRKTYWLRVPPTTQTARQAVAWTFGMGGPEYSPLSQT